MAKVVLAVKKAIEVKFTEFKKLGDHPLVTADDTSSTGFQLKTLENPEGFEVTVGDWICEGTMNDPYAIKPDRFTATYDITQVIQEE